MLNILKSPVLTEERAFVLVLTEERASVPTTVLLREPPMFFRYTNQCRPASPPWAFSFFPFPSKLATVKMKKALHFMQGFGLVPTTGFEPAHLLAPPPQDGVSTNFTTRAIEKEKGQLPALFSFFVIPLGLEPRAHTLKVYCSTS